MDPTLNDALSRIDTLWVLVAGILVFFMQAGFLLLEVGFSRMKNAGTVVAKVIANLSIDRTLLLGGRLRARVRRCRLVRRHRGDLPRDDRAGHWSISIILSQCSGL